MEGMVSFVSFRLLHSANSSALEESVSREACIVDSACLSPTGRWITLQVSLLGEHFRRLVGLKK
eukprot:scaffold26806_cov78-Skeletonema_dohrnii-CCMP3373.AAC.1